MGLEDFFNSRMAKKNEAGKYEFSMTDYDKIPQELRGEYISKTYAPPAKTTEARVSRKSDKDTSVEFSDAIGVGVEVPQKKVTPERLEEIKTKIRFPEPEPQEVPSEQVRIPAQEDTSYDWLPALAPLAAEALFGGNGKSAGESLGISGNYLLKNEADKKARRQKLEEKLWEIEKSRLTGGKKGDSKLYEVDENGVPTYRTREQAIGSQVYKTSKDGKKLVEVDEGGLPILRDVNKAEGMQAFKDNKRSGLSFEERVEIMKRNAALKKDLEAYKQKNKKEEKATDLEKYYGTERTKLKFTQETRDVVDAFNKLSSLDPESKDPIQDISVVFDFMKTLDPTSVVRESEQGLVLGAKTNRDFVENLSDILSKNRKLTPDQVRNIQKFAALTYQRRLDTQGSQVDERYKKIVKKYGLDPNVVLESLSVGTPLMWKNTKTGKVRLVVVPNDQVEEFLKQGAQRVK